MSWPLSTWSPRRGQVDKPEDPAEDVRQRPGGQVTSEPCSEQVDDARRARLRDYLAQHDLHRIVEDAMHAVLLDLPDEPLDALCEHIQKQKQTKQSSALFDELVQLQQSIQLAE